MWRKKERSALEKLLPRGSWLDSRPELKQRTDVNDLLIELDALEAALTGVLGDDRRLTATKALVEDQFRAVEAELGRFHEDTEIDDLCEYVRELQIGYARHLAERGVEG